MDATVMQNNRVIHVRPFFVGAFVLVCFACTGRVVAVAESLPAVTTFLETHCIDCHGADGEGDVDLQELIQGQEDSPQLIELVHHVIERHEMPPEEIEQPSKEARQRVADELYELLAERKGPHFSQTYPWKLLHALFVFTSVHLEKGDCAWTLVVRQETAAQPSTTTCFGIGILASNLHSLLQWVSAHGH